MDHRFTDEQIMHMQGLLKLGMIRDYYAFQRNYGRSFGGVAANISGNTTRMGRMAVNNLKASIGEERAQNLHGKLTQDLAQADLEQIKVNKGGIPTQSDIEKYHAKEFKRNNVPLEAFGGALSSSLGRDWMGDVVEKPSQGELKGGNSDAFSNIDKLEAAANVVESGVQTSIESAGKDWFKGGRTTQFGSVINEGGPLGQTMALDDSYPAMPMPEARKPIKLPPNPTFKDLVKRHYGDVYSK